MTRRAFRPARGFDAGPANGPRDGQGGPGRDVALWVLAGVLAIAGAIFLALPSGTDDPTTPPQPSPSSTHSSVHATSPTQARPGIA